jgi:hypothetical protein
MRPLCSWFWLLVLVPQALGGAARKETLPFDGDARLAIQRDVVYGNAAPEDARHERRSQGRGRGFVQPTLAARDER